MKFESKYDIGQELWRIVEKIKLMPETECKCCHVKTRQEIRKLGIVDAKNKVRYVMFYPKGVVRYALLHQTISEDEIGETYFTTREAAQARCDELNKEAGV